MRVEIRWKAGPGPARTFPLPEHENLLGREPGITVALPKDLAGVSLRHAKIVFDGKSHWLEDLNSKNKTFLNGQPVVRERLRHLDVIGLGRSVDLLFVVRAEEVRPGKRRGIVRAVIVPQDPDALPQEIPKGSVTLGRSLSLANITVESRAVSGIHARIERTTDQLVIQDLGSSNGTFVNGNRVMTAVLRDGDVISLAMIEFFKVEIEMGEVTAVSGVYGAPVPPPKAAGDERPRFSQEWKTRYEWDSGELEALADLQRVHAEQARGSTDKAGVAKTPPPAAVKTPPSPKPAEKTVAPAPVAPKAEPPPAKPAPAAEATVLSGPKTASPPPAAPKPAAPPAVKPPPPAPSAAPAEAPSAAEVTVVRPAEVAKRGVPGGAPIAEVRLSAAGIDLVVRQPGAHDLGRSRSMPLRIDNLTISRRHARIILGEDRTIAYVQDRGGQNGTRLNGVLVDGIRPLSEGDVITVGEVNLTVSLKP